MKTTYKERIMKTTLESTTDTQSKPSLIQDEMQDAKILAKRKQASLSVAKTLKTSNFEVVRKVGKSMSMCADVLEFERCPRLAKTPNCPKPRLKTTIRCQSRMCLFCAKGLATRSFNELTAACDLALKAGKFFPVFLTLTVPNCPGDEIRSMYKKMGAALPKLLRKTPVKSMLQGSYISKEITYNEKRNDYHPHIHALLFMKVNYCKHGYISQKNWLRMWQEAMGDNTIRAVDIKKVKGKKDKMAHELTKYITKPGTLVSVEDGRFVSAKLEILESIFFGTRNVRMQAYTGVLKKAKALLKGKTDEAVEKIACKSCKQLPEIFEKKWQEFLQMYIE